MLNPARVDAAVDLAYGGLILLAIALIATVEFGIGIAFAVGVFAAYVLHVVWKMARFDPEWMTTVVEDAVDDAVGDSVEQAVEDSVEQAVDDTVEQAMDDSMDQAVDDRVATQVEETIGDRLDSVRAQVEAVDDRLDSATDGDHPVETDDARTDP